MILATHRIKNCLNCSRELTAPVSMYIGYGPICSEKLGIDRPTYDELLKLNPENAEDLKRLTDTRRLIQAEQERRDKIDGTLTLQGETLITKFKYGCDNFNRIKEAVKSVRPYKWNHTDKQWETPLSELHPLTEKLRPFENISIDPELVALVEETKAQYIACKQEEATKPIGVAKILDGQVGIQLNVADANFRTVKNTIKGQGSRWDAKSKFWLYPLIGANIQQIMETIKQYHIEGCEELKAEVDTTKLASIARQEMSKATDADITIDGLSGELYPFQKAGVAYAIKNKKTLIADEMGLGKTVQSIAWLQAKQFFPALIVCPASLKLNWQKEFNFWLPGRKTAVISGTGSNGADVMEYADVTIINYDILTGRLEQLQKIGFKAIVLDESHYIKNSKAQRTKAALELRKGIEHRLLLTGTPVLNRPLELITPLTFLNKLEVLGGFWSFVKRYCNAKRTAWGWDMSGASNLKELNEKLRQTCMVRRRKQDVLTELPDKQRAFIPVEIDNRVLYEDAEKNFAFWLEEIKGKKLGENVPDGTVLETTWLTGPNARAQQASYPEKLVQIEILKQLAAKGKLAAVKEWITDFLETGEKLVVFAHHKEIIADLANSFPVDSRVVLIGDTSMVNRQTAVERFQNDEKIRLFIGSTKAAGVGLTLTKASNVAFVELGWTPADHDQAEDRCHRIGQKDAVTAWYFIANGTIEETIQQLILSKRAVVNTTTDGVEETNVVEKVIDAIISSIGG